jgi:trimeric autotransporter adhesin
VAITIPGVGAYVSGSPTVAHTWCPSGTVGNAATTLFYPQGDSVPALTNALTATTDGQHILGAAVSGGAVTLSDIGITIPTSADKTPAACPVSSTGVMSPLIISHTLNQVPVSGVSATAVNQVVASPQSKLAFITYNGTTAGAALPYYIPGIGGAAGTVGYVTLGGSAASAITAPLTGAFSPDDTYFFVSTAGDNLIHYITIPATVTTATPPADTQQIAPNLPACTPGSDPNCILTDTTAPASGIVPATAIVVKPRSTT